MWFFIVLETHWRLGWFCLVLSCLVSSSRWHDGYVLPFLCPDWLNGIVLVFTQVNHSFSWVVDAVDVAGIFVYIFQFSFFSLCSRSLSVCVFFSLPLHLSIFPLPKVICKNGIIYESSFCWFAPRASSHTEEKNRSKYSALNEQYWRKKTWCRFQISVFAINAYWKYIK